MINFDKKVKKNSWHGKCFILVVKNERIYEFKNWLYGYTG